MKVVYSDAHRHHAGGKELVFNQLLPMFEKPERMDIILAQLEASGFGETTAPQAFGPDPMLRVHDGAYIAFLREAFALYRQEEDEEDESAFVLPFVFGMRRLRQAPGKSAFAKLGHYCFDLSVPFVEGTWRAVEASCDVALTGSKLIQEGESSVFSLCRPPGHHAASDLAGGYCYVNNVAVAAQAFIDAGAARVAILDVDYHHGNGTQSIFYDRNDVLFVSLHGDPDQEYPYFAGFAEETGSGAGEGYTLNLPMPWGTDWLTYVKALEVGLAKIRDYGPDVLLVSLGVDTYKADPISKFRLEHESYLKLGAAIAGLKLPSLFVMEGGYAVAEIGINVVNTLTGFEDAA